MVEITAKQREKIGKRAGIIGIAVNICLAFGKMAAGMLFGLISVMADGLNNLTDCGSSMISLLSFKLSSKPADKEHPYGHERIEYICSLVVAFIIMLVALETVKEAVEKIIAPTDLKFSYLAIGVLLVSILAKGGLYVYYNNTAKKIHSDILRASAVDSLSDCVSTTVVLITLILAKFSSINADGYAGVLVALFIAWSGIGIVRETFSKLIGQAPDKQMLEDIKQRVLSREAVLGVHDLSVYSYGPNKYFASVHVEVDANVNVLVSHELVDEIERDFALNTNIILTGHLDPIVTDDECVNTLRGQTLDILKGLDDRLSMHDFRMVVGEKRTNVLFDVAVPYGAMVDKEQLKKDLETNIGKIDNKYCCIITIENTL